MSMFGTDTDLLDGIIGQTASVQHLRAALSHPLHAYLFLGPADAGLRDAAIRFAGELLAARSTVPQRERDFALREQHPDLVVYDRIGTAMTVEQARDAVSEAAKAPVSGQQKVIVIGDVDRAALQAPILLKSVEEPPPTCIFILIAESIDRAIEPLASRCAIIKFEGLSEHAITTTLTKEGIDPDLAAASAAAADGSITRARSIATDPTAAERVQTWERLRSTLNGKAASAMIAADKAKELADQAVAFLEDRHKKELKEADKQAELYGSNAGRKTLTEQHKRELRRGRNDEFSLGFAILTNQIRNDTLTGTLTAGNAVRQMSAISEASEAIRFNGKPELLLANLFVRLGRTQ